MEGIQPQDQRPLAGLPRGEASHKVEETGSADPVYCTVPPAAQLGQRRLLQQTVMVWCWRCTGALFALGFFIVCCVDFYTVIITGPHVHLVYSVHKNVGKVCHCTSVVTHG